MSPGFTMFETGLSLDWVMKMQTLLPALDLPCIRVNVPCTDFKLYISLYIISTWQCDWNGVVANKLQSVCEIG